MQMAQVSSIFHLFILNNACNNEENWDEFAQVPPTYTNIQDVFLEISSVAIVTGFGIAFLFLFARTVLKQTVLGLAQLFNISDSHDNIILSNIFSAVRAG